MDKISGRPTGFLQRIAVQEGTHFHVLRLKEVDWVEADRKHLCLHIGNKVHRVRQTMAELKRSLNPRQFLQVHRSHVVNVDSIAALDFSKPSSPFVVLTSGKRVALARSYKRDLREALAHIG